eukprot:s1719_g17.t1
MAQALRRAGRIPTRCTGSGLDQSELNQITAPRHHIRSLCHVKRLIRYGPKGLMISVWLKLEVWNEQEPRA